MNFEFLKGLTGLGYVYENCSNAEKLAITMPVQSVFTSRKSAELLARFIYLAAHNQEVEMLTFVDILSDSTVQRFINSRPVINAFHHIRTSIRLRYLGVDRQWIQNYWNRTLIEEEHTHHEQDRHKKLCHLGTCSAD